MPVPPAGARDRRVSAAARLCALLLLIPLTCVARVSAHDIPRDITVRAFAKPEGQRFRLLLRVPLKAVMDVEFPRRERDLVDLARVDPSLHDAARIWLSNRIELFEDDGRLADPRIASARLSLESDRSFDSYDRALAHVTGPPLSNDTSIYWEQGLLDVLFEYPIRSDRSSFSIHAAFQRLGLRVVTAMQFMAPGAIVRTYELEGDAGLVRLDPSRLQAAVSFARLGFLLLVRGPDYLLLLLCFVLPFRSVRSLAPIVVSFSVAYSITMIASASTAAPAAAWFAPTIETLMAAAIVYVALENVVFAYAAWDRPLSGNVVIANVARRSIAALLCGVVFGFGFSSSLQHTLQFAGAHTATALALFNVGVELGQLFVLTLFFLALGVLFRFGFAERMVTIALSAIVAHTAWHWTSDRFELLRQQPWPERTLVDTGTAALWLIAIAALASAAWLAFAWRSRPGRRNAEMTAAGKQA
jgi:hypothetical protein